MRKKHGVVTIATVLVAGLATFLPGVIGGQGHGALPAQARTMSNPATNSVHGSPRVIEVITNQPAVHAVGGFFFTYVTGKVVDYVLKATKKVFSKAEDSSESSSAADAEEALAFIGRPAVRRQVAALFPTGDSQFNATG
jgi:hypothetical protein